MDWSEREREQFEHNTTRLTFLSFTYKWCSGKTNESNLKKMMKFSEPRCLDIIYSNFPSELIDLSIHTQFASLYIARIYISRIFISRIFIAKIYIKRASTYKWTNWCFVDQQNYFLFLGELGVLLSVHTHVHQFSDLKIHHQRKNTN